MKIKKNRLPAGTRLDEYTIVKPLGGGGFSIVYLGQHVHSGQTVVIKEYFPGKLAQRNSDLSVNAKSDEVEKRFQNGRSLFFQEADILAKLRHNNIVKVLSFFRAYNTVYMVMEYEQGANLQHYIAKHGGYLTERFLLTVFPPLLDALQMIHEQGYLHQDIKPGNIHIRPGGKPLLLDFGAAHRLMVSRQFQPGHITTTGFSPIEQYDKNGYMGAWTDIYSIGATMRACIEGKAPQDAKSRHMKDTLKPAAELYRKDYSRDLLQAIDWSMEVDPLLRPQSAAALRETLPMLEPGGARPRRLARG